jgi:hypothetical protein
MSGREELVGAYLRLHPESAARLLESMPADEANAVLNAVDVTTAAPVVGQMLPTHAAHCFEIQPTVRCCSSNSAARSPWPCCAICGPSIAKRS